MKGVVAYFDHKDIPGVNNYVFVMMLKDVEELFCSGKVQYAGQPVGFIVADTAELARAAAAKVRITYKNHKQPVVDIKEAMKDNKNRVIPSVKHSVGKKPEGEQCYFCAPPPATSSFSVCTLKYTVKKEPKDEH